MIVEFLGGPWDGYTKELPYFQYSYRVPEAKHTTSLSLMEYEQVTTEPNYYIHLYEPSLDPETGHYSINDNGHHLYEYQGMRRG